MNAPAHLDLGERRVATLLFLGVALVWGLNYLFVRGGLQLSAPLWLAASRASIGAVGVAAYLLVRSPRTRLDARGRRDALLLGIPNTTLFFGLWFVAANQVLPGETAVVVYTFPLWVALLSGPILGGPRLPLVALISVVTGFVGVVLLSQPWAGGSSSIPVVPVIELLLGALSWAVGTVLLQRRFPAPQLAEANLFQLAGGSAGLLGASLLLEPHQVPGFSWALVGTVLWLGLLGTAFAYATWVWLLGRIPAPRLSAYTFLVPVVALAASAVIFSERLGVVQLGGVTLVLASLLLLGRGSVVGR